MNFLFKNYGKREFWQCFMALLSRSFGLPEGGASFVLIRLGKWQQICALNSSNSSKLMKFKVISCTLGVIKALFDIFATIPVVF